jgi:hypothetical protein
MPPPLPPDIEAAINDALKPSSAIPSRSRIWSEEEYYKDITAPPVRGPLPPLPPDVQAAVDEAFAGLAAIFANAPPSKPGRGLFSPGMIQHDLVRKRDGSIAFMPSVGTILVIKACRDVFEREEATGSTDTHDMKVGN